MTVQSGYLLVVEDIPDTLELLDATLKFKGYRVVTARNGQEALEAVRKERPEMVITDILMPKMDGFGLVHRLRINPDTREIPVVFLTATYVAPEDKAFADSIGVTRFMEKPFEMEDFLKMVADLLAAAPPPVSGPLEEFEFYDGYRQRLETKLEQKSVQIARDERILEGLPEDEKANFRSDLRQSVSDREEIRLLLEQIKNHLATLTPPG